jgi:acetoin utilization deacetylase AcuC-like enzyme
MKIFNWLVKNNKKEKKLKVFFNQKQVAKGNSSFSPSAGKPALALESWLGKWGDKIEVVESGTLTVADLALAHEKVYVEEVLSRRRTNGFSNTSKEVAESLPYNNASFVEAALEAYQNGGFTVSPTSGFHHARYDSGGGFCTFNGLMVAAQKLFQKGAKKVGILDLDAHYGDGTDDIIDKLDLDDKIEHWTYGGSKLGSASNAVKFLEELPNIIDSMYNNGIEILLVQCGADPHISDPLGGSLNNEQMRKRDKIVFEHCAKYKIPCVWNLAGGYQIDEKTGSIRAVLDIHDASMEECLKVIENGNSE